MHATAENRRGREAFVGRSAAACQPKNNSVRGTYSRRTEGSVETWLMIEVGRGRRLAVCVGEGPDGQCARWVAAGG